MDCEHKLKALEQEIESLKEENRLLKEKLSSSQTCKTVRTDEEDDEADAGNDERC